MEMLSLSPLNDIRIGGHVGAKLDVVLHSRILSPHARTEILGEAVDAFRRRVDDRLKPGSGLWQGEFWGKWMLSAVAAQRYTGDEALLESIRHSCNELTATQDDDGYIGTYSNSGFVQSSDGNMNWNIWCRKYTLWGLIEAHELLQDDRLLATAIRFMDHLAQQVGPDRIPIIETGQFYGLPSTSILLPVVRLYRHTGEERFLDYAHYIVEQWAAHPVGPPDILRKGLTGTPVHEWFPEPEKWTKAYEFISCVEGLVELYRLEGRQEWLDCALAIHLALRDYERNIFGGIGKNDKLLASRYLLETEAEICDSVYWQRLTTQLLCLTGDPLYGDEIERTLYNVLCGAMNAEGSWGLRRQCLSGEHWPAPRHCELEHHQCCVANLPRGLLQAAQTVACTRPGGLALVLFIPGNFRLSAPSGQTVDLIVETNYPESGCLRVRIELASPETFTLAVRIPGWSEQTELRVNDRMCPSPAHGTFAEVKRSWNHGDIVQCNLDMRGRVAPFPVSGDDLPKPYVAVERGPLVLARDIRLGDPEIDASVGIDTSESCHMELTEADPAEGMWLAYRTLSKVTPGVSFCDYSSAGQTWNRETSAFRVWLPVNTKKG